jgi:hypothetical protein
LLARSIGREVDGTRMRGGAMCGPVRHPRAFGVGHDYCPRL